MESYESNYEDLNVELLGYRPKSEFETISEGHRKKEDFLNDTFVSEGNFDSRINVITLGSASSHRNVGLFTVKKGLDVKMVRFTGSLCESMIVGRRHGVTEEMSRLARKFEEFFDIDHDTVFPEYMTHFGKFRQDIAATVGGLYYPMFAASLHLAFGDRLNLDIVDHLKKNKIYPLTEEHKFTLNFFHEHLD
tara:strand:+ start:14755 stop:15330 length:576 start_codon:yes stop_codon:yes gene_type:complete